MKDGNKIKMVGGIRIQMAFILLMNGKRLMENNTTLALMTTC